MNNPAHIKKEARYGMPQADHILFNRYYTIGYSYYFRQAKWALEIVDPEMVDIERLNNFREDLRIPDQFRAELKVYQGSGYDRGHLICSADKDELEIQNSETFLLSNMSPQRPGFNRGIWKNLEDAIRVLDAKRNIWETYVVCGPIFYFDKPVEYVGNSDEGDITIPIPNAFFKSVLTEKKSGDIDIWSFIIPNEDTDEPLETFLVPTTKIEKYSGMFMWENLVGSKIKREKGKIRRMWSF